MFECRMSCFKPFFPNFLKLNPQMNRVSLLILGFVKDKFFS